MKISLIKVSILILTILLVALIGYGVFVYLNKQKEATKLVETLPTEEQIVAQQKETSDLKSTIEEKEITINSGTAVEDVKSWPLYENSYYKYGVLYPTDWFFFKDEAEQPLTKEEGVVPEGATESTTSNFLTGGPIFWSNYENFDSYTAENSPNDLFLLTFIVYKDTLNRNLSIDQFADEQFSYSVENGAQTMDVKGYNINGKQFFIADSEFNEKFSAIIFKDVDQFYVFHLGFKVIDDNVLGKMLSIAKTFGLTK